MKSLLLRIQSEKLKIEFAKKMFYELGVQRNYSTLKLIK